MAGTDALFEAEEDGELSAMMREVVEGLGNNDMARVLLYHVAPTFAPARASSRSVTSTFCRLQEVERRDGWETLRVQFDHPEEAVFMVLGMGSRAEVLGPESLRERVAGEIRGMAERIAEVKSETRVVAESRFSHYLDSPLTR